MKSQDEIQAEHILDCSTSLFHFTKAMFRARKGIDFIENWHHKAICSVLERVFLGNILRLVINMPPRYSKTELAVINFMAWTLGIYPDSEFIHASYSHRLATINAYNARSLVQSEEYREVFPTVNLMADSSAKDEWRTTRGGCVYASGSGGTITGFGAGKSRDGFGGCIIIDDPIKPDEALSDTVRENVIEWFKNTIESRCNSRHTPIIIIMQRLHQQDLAGWLLDGGNGEEWSHLCIPALDSNNKPLWEFKHTYSDLMRLQASDEYNFAGQYLQTPSPIGGGILKSSWWRRWPKDKKLPKCEHIFNSWDTAYSEESFKTSSSSAKTKWGVFYDPVSQLYALILLGAWDGKVDYPTLRSKAVQEDKEDKPDCHLIEKKASGQSLIQDLRNAGIKVRTYNPDRDKISRAYAVSAMLQSGQIYAPEEPWAQRVIDMLALFPNGASPSSDYTDTCTQAWLYLRNGQWVHHPDDELFSTKQKVIKFNPSDPGAGY